MFKTASFPAKNTIGMCMAEITRYITSNKYLNSYFDLEILISTSLLTSDPKISRERMLIRMYTKKANPKDATVNFIPLCDVRSLSEVNNGKKQGWKQNATNMFGIVMK
jgi:hypothetical protein